MWVVFQICQLAYTTPCTFASLELSIALLSEIMTRAKSDNGRRASSALWCLVAAPAVVLAALAALVVRGPPMSMFPAGKDTDFSAPPPWPAFKIGMTLSGMLIRAGRALIPPPQLVSGDAASLLGGRSWGTLLRLRQW
jgi:hypothetical protein